MFVNSDTILNRAMASGHGATLGRRQFFQVGGVTAAGLLLPRLTGAATSQPVVKHVFSFIGEFSTDGAFVSSMLTGPDAGTVDLALSRDPGMGQATFVGQQPVHPLDHMVHHDLGGLLQPGTQYFARLAVGSKMFGRVLAFRTQVADDERMDLQIVLTSCQRNWGKVTMQKGWDAVRAYGPDLLLHMGDFGYWGNSLRATTPYVTHILKYASQLSGILSMRAALETCCSLIQVSDHETSGNNGDNHEDPITATALEAYWRLMPFRVFDDPTRRSRFLARKLGTNVLLISPDFRSLDRSPGANPDTRRKTAWGKNQFALVKAALKRPEALKIVLSDPGCNPSSAPSSPAAREFRDKWCNYQCAFQRFADVIRYETTTDGQPIQADVWSGDQHILSVLEQRRNPWGPFDVLTSSGIDQHALPLEPDEMYDQVFGQRTHPGSKIAVSQHMQIDVTDDKVGTITRVATGYDDFTGEQVVHSEKVFHYEPSEQSPGRPTTYAGASHSR